MGRSTFLGPLQQGRPTTIGIVPAVRSLLLPVTAIANTDLILTIPKAQILGFRQLTGVAYTAATIAMSLGTTVGGAEIASAIDIKAQAYRNTLALVATGVPTLLAWPGGSLYVRLAQGTPTATGSGTLFVDYLPLDEGLAA